MAHLLRSNIFNLPIKKRNKKEQISIKMTKINTRRIKLLDPKA